jgi:hypothetical protein
MPTRVPLARPLLIHFPKLFKSGLEVIEQLRARCTLGIDAWDPFDPSYPPGTIALNDGFISR